MNRAPTPNPAATQHFSASERALIWVLRITGLMALTAVVGVGMPWSWMVQIHACVGMGELPAAPVVEYLARSASSLYAYHGAVALALSLDVRRYRPLVRIMGFVSLALAVTMLIIDLKVGMPWFWTASEVPYIAALGLALLLLARPPHANSQPA